MGFRAPAPSAIGPMHNTDTTSLPDLVIYDDELLLDTTDPSTYTVCNTAAEIAAALTTDRATGQR